MVCDKKWDDATYDALVFMSFFKVINIRFGNTNDAG